MDDVSNQQHQKLIFDTFHDLVRARLNAGCKHTIIDATNLVPMNRKALLEIAFKYGAQVYAYQFVAPKVIALERNSYRKRQVSPKVIERQFENFQLPTLTEGFWQIVTIDSNGIEINRERIDEGTETDYRACAEHMLALKR